MNKPKLEDKPKTLEDVKKIKKPNMENKKETLVDAKVEEQHESKDLSNEDEEKRSLKANKLPVMDADQKETKEQTQDSNELLSLGLIHKIARLCFTFKTATILVIVFTAISNLSEAISLFLLVWQLCQAGFTRESLAIVLTEYAALPLCIIHYFVANMTGMVPKKTMVLELTVLVVCYPIAPSISLLYWGITRVRKRPDFRVHNMAKVLSLIRGVFISPFQVANIGHLYLTSSLSPPWEEQAQYCDSLQNCLPIGSAGTVIPLVAAGFTLISAAGGFLEAHSADGIFQTIEIFSIVMPNFLFRIGSFVLVSSLFKEWSLLLIFSVMITNFVVFRCIHSKVKYQNIFDLTSALTSILGFSVLREEHTKKERNCEIKDTSEKLKEIQTQVTKSSLATFPWFVLSNVLIYFSISTETLNTNTNAEMSHNQISWMLRYVFPVLAFMSVLSTVIFRFSFRKMNESCFKIMKLAMNLATILATIGVIIAASIHLPPRPTSLIVAIQTRDRIDVIHATTWNTEWEKGPQEWNFTEGAFLNNEGVHLKVLETNMSNIQNLDAKNFRTLAMSASVSRYVEEESIISILKPFPSKPNTNKQNASCAKCPDSKSNYCQRFLFDVIQMNPHMLVCQDAIDGTWGRWDDGPCQAVREVEPGKPCGKGWRMQERKCYGRSYGGKYCTGRAANHTSCLDEECPGKEPIAKTGHNLFPEWRKVNGTCDAKKGRKGQQQEILYSPQNKPLKIRESTCFNQFSDGNIFHVSLIFVYFLSGA